MPRTAVSPCSLTLYDSAGYSRLEIGKASLQNRAKNIEFTLLTDAVKSVMRE
jgi:hypothetical protein